MRRGMSPLVSGVLLLVFALVLGMVILAWAGQTEQEVKGCDGVQLAWITLENKVLTCSLGNAVQVALENTGSEEITGLVIQLRQPKGVVNIDYLTYLQAGYGEVFTVPLGIQAQNLKVVPVSRGRVCGQNGIVLENVMQCTS